MYNLLSKYGQVGAFVLGTVLVLIFMIGAFSGAGDYNFDTMSDAEIYKVNIFNFGIYVAIGLAVISAAAMLLFGLYHLATNFKNSIGGIIGIVAIVVMFFIFKGSSVAEIADHHPSIQGAIERYLSSAEGNVITQDNLTFIGGIIRTGFVLLVLSFVSLIVMPIISPIINRIK